MIRLVHTEFFKLRTTRAVIGTVALLFAFVVLVTFLAALLHKASSVPGEDPGLRDAGTQQDILGVGLAAPLFALIIGLVISTGEFRHGTITPTLLATPRRTLVLIAKLIAGALLGALLVLLTFVLSVGLETLALAIRSIPNELFHSALLDIGGRLVGVGLLWGALGAAVGTAFRSQTVTVIAAIIWVLIVEQIIHGLVSSVGKLLPFSAMLAVLGAGDDDKTFVGTTAGVALSLGWVALFGALAALLLRRDVS